MLVDTLASFMEQAVNILVVFVVICLLIKLYQYHASSRLPPGPFAWPVIGNIRWFEKDPQGYKKFTELARQYGNVYRLYCGSTLIVMINGYDVIHEAFTKQANIFTDRPQLFAPLIGVSKGTGLTYNSGHAWKTLRRFTLQALRDFGVGKLTLEERIREEITVLTRIFKEARESPVRAKPYLLSAATNIICSVMFGARFDYSESKFIELTEVLEGIFKLNAPFAKENFFPFTRSWPSGKELIRKRTAAIERVKTYLAETIEEHKATFDSENIRDFIDLYIKASRDETEPELFTEANVYKIIVDLFLAGGETTGTSLDWSLLYMILKPEIQEKCYNELLHLNIHGALWVYHLKEVYPKFTFRNKSEHRATTDFPGIFGKTIGRVRPIVFPGNIDDYNARYRRRTILKWRITCAFMGGLPYQVVGSGRPVTLSDRPGLTYVQATLLELQRISNTLTYSLPHVANQDAELCGFHIPKDSIVIANLYSAHIDPKYWPEPEQFRPERFIDDNGKLIRKDGLVPFGDGPRLCIGEPLARMELFLIFTNLIQQFEFKKALGQQYSLDGIQALTLTALPYQLIAVPR